MSRTGCWREEITVRQYRVVMHGARSHLRGSGTDDRCDVNQKDWGNCSQKRRRTVHEMTNAEARNSMRRRSPAMRCFSGKK